MLAWSRRMLRRPSSDRRLSMQADTMSCISGHARVLCNEGVTLYYQTRGWVKHLSGVFRFSLFYLYLLWGRKGLRLYQGTGKRRENHRPMGVFLLCHFFSLFWFHCLLITKCYESSSTLSGCYVSIFNFFFVRFLW